MKTRSDIWLKLTSICFKGKVIADLERLLQERRRFDVVELARKSDVNCQFNATAVGAVSSCEVGKKKYDRGILCSDATLRCTQKRVLNLAKSLGFSSFPTEEEGKVWCWGDEHGEFVTAGNRYVYEVYVKADKDGATQLEEGSYSFDEDSDGSLWEDEQYDSEDMLWCTSVARLDTWDQCVDTGSKYSKRVKYQLLPLLL